MSDDGNTTTAPETATTADAATGIVDPTPTTETTEATPEVVQEVTPEAAPEPTIEATPEVVQEPVEELNYATNPPTRTLDPETGAWVEIDYTAEATA